MQAIWFKKDLPTKTNGYKVFSCFACGGGSSFGYKLAGYEMVGANDIDPEMAEIYQLNHNPKHYFLMDIRELVAKEDLPPELYNLDILDGSPPCSSFSMVGNREKDWGKKKKFREGQADQTLDDLFFNFIDLAKKLQPKIVVAENVKGLISGNAQRYVKEIREAFNVAGYDCQLFLLNGAYMGVPQRRERVFFVARRKDLALPKLALEFALPPVTFGQIRTDKGLVKVFTPGTKMYHVWQHRKKSDSNFAPIAERLYGKSSYFSENILHDDKVPQTIVSGSGYYVYDLPQTVSSNDLISIQTFPQDYDFIKQKHTFIKYVLGMSVPPFMTKGVAEQISAQLLSQL